MSIININFDDGSKKIEINGDSNKVLTWNPTDINFVDRYLIFADWVQNEYAKKAEELSTSLSSIEDYKVGTVVALGDEFNIELDKVFGEGTSKIAFGNMNPISPISNGKFLFENFINALDPVINESFDKFESNSEKYEKQANQLKRNLKK